MFDSSFEKRAKEYGLKLDKTIDSKHFWLESIADTKKEIKYQGKVLRGSYFVRTVRGNKKGYGIYCAKKRLK